MILSFQYLYRPVEICYHLSKDEGNTKILMYKNKLAFEFGIKSEMVLQNCFCVMYVVQKRQFFNNIVNHHYILLSHHCNKPENPQLTMIRAFLYNNEYFYDTLHIQKNLCPIMSHDSHASLIKIKISKAVHWLSLKPVVKTQICS